MVNSMMIGGKPPLWFERECISLDLDWWVEIMSLYPGPNPDGETLAHLHRRAGCSARETMLLTGWTEAQARLRTDYVTVDRLKRKRRVGRWRIKRRFGVYPPDQSLDDLKNIMDKGFSFTEAAKMLNLNPT